MVVRLRLTTWGSSLAFYVLRESLLIRKPRSQLRSDESSGNHSHSSGAGLLPVAISSSLRFVRSEPRFSPTWLKLETSSLSFNRLKTSVCPWQSKLTCLRELGFLSRSSCMISHGCCHCLTIIAIALYLGGRKDAHWIRRWCS